MPAEPRVLTFRVIVKPHESTRIVQPPEFFQEQAQRFLAKLMEFNSQGPIPSVSVETMPTVEPQPMALLRKLLVGSPSEMLAAMADAKKMMGLPE